MPINRRDFLKITAAAVLAIAAGAVALLFRRPKKLGIEKLSHVQLLKQKKIVYVYTEQIKTLFGSALIAYWPLDEVSGTSVLDVPPVRSYPARLWSSRSYRWVVAASGDNPRSAKRASSRS